MTELNDESIVEQVREESHLQNESQDQSVPKPVTISEDFIIQMKEIFGDKDPFPKLIQEREACVSLSETAYFLEEISPFLLSLLLFVSDEPEITGHLSTFIDYLPEVLTAQAQEGTTSIKINRLLAFYNHNIYPELKYHRLFLEYALRAIHSRLPTYINRQNQTYSDPYDYSTMWDLLSKVFGVRIKENFRGEAFYKKVVKINPSNRIHIDEGQYQKRKEYNLELVLDQREEEFLSLKKVPYEKVKQSSLRGLTRDYATIINQNINQILRLLNDFEQQTQKTKQLLITFVSDLLLKRVCSDFERLVKSKNAFGTILTQFYIEANRAQLSKEQFSAGILCQKQTADAGVSFFIDSSKQIIRHPIEVQATNQTYEGLIALEMADGQCSQDNYFLLKNRLEIVEEILSLALGIFLSPRKTIPEKEHMWNEQFSMIARVKNNDIEDDVENQSADSEEEVTDSLLEELDGEL